MSLTPKQRRFVEAYLIDPNGKKAAIAAGYSEKSAAVEANRLLTNAKIVAEIEKAQKILSYRTGVTPERVLAELAKVGFSDIRQLVQWRSNVTEIGEDPETGEPQLKAFNEVQIRDSFEVDDDTAAAISEVSQTKDGALKVKMHDKLGALVKIGQHLGMFKTPAKPSDDDAQFDAKPSEDVWDRVLN